jgi:hypothetical protein
MDVLARHPDVKTPHIIHGLIVYPIDKTPFIVVYEYDDAELRVHFIFIRSKPIDDIDPATAEW